MMYQFNRSEVSPLSDERLDSSNQGDKEFYQIQRMSYQLD